MSALLGAGLACFILGIALDLLNDVARRALRTVPYALAVAGSCCLVIVGARTTVGMSVLVDLTGLFGVGHNGLHIDALAGLFLTLLFALSAAVSASAISWARAERHVARGVASGFLLVLASVAVILTASDAFVFLFAWETLSVAFFILTAATRHSRNQPATAWATLGMGKVSGAALLLAFLLLAGRTGSLSFSSWHSVGPGALHDVAWVLVVVGFGAKIGIAPFHVWIPRGYNSAPGPTRAALAGIAANVGVYGLWRFLAVLGRPPVWLVVGVLVVGGVSALFGITFAAVQSRLGRVFAYSSIENAGLIVTAYGVALVGTDLHSPSLVAVGLLAATLQTVAHAVAKSALFASLAHIEAATGTDDLDALRGIGRRLPWSGTALAVGALTLAGLPPTIGFVSEWFILEALMQQFRVGGLALRLALAGAGALVALTVGVAVLAFLRVLGLTLLGPPTEHIERRDDAGLVAKVGLSTLIAGCLGLAIASPWEVHFIARGLSPVVPRSATSQALKSPWILQPVFHGFSILSPTWLWIIMPIAILSVTLGALLLSRGRYLRVRRVAAWHSGTSGVEGRAAYTSFGFANPLRHVLAGVLGTRREREVVVTASDSPTERHEHVVTRTTVVEPFVAYLYQPVRSATLKVANVTKRLQNGRLNYYVAYMLIALLAALAITSALH